MGLPALPSPPHGRRGLLALAVASGVYAYAATNTVPSSNAGSGSGTISGYTVSNIAYTLNSTTPTNLDQVAFTIAPAATTHREGAARVRRVVVQLHEHLRQRYVQHHVTPGDGRRLRPS